MSSISKDMDPDDPTKGSIIYKGLDAAKTPAGIFSTAYYFRETDCLTCTDFKGQDSPWTKTDVYKTGLIQYLKVTEEPNFKDWKLVIYIDQHSIENPVFKNSNKNNAARIDKHNKEWAEIEKHPNVVFGIVTWPEYAVGSKGDGKTIDNAIIRALRMKAFHDFPAIPVFIRDADTLFENLVKSDTFLNGDPPLYKKIAIWEWTLFQNLQKLFVESSPYRILIASQPNYQRQWHVHPDTGVKTTGCYAAVTSTIGNVPEWTDGSLWRKCLAYFRKHCTVVQQGNDRKPNNLDKPTYIGKDEQLVSYVIIANILEKVYFYYLEYIQVEGGPVQQSDDTPFAGDLLAAGIKQYPSPYMRSLNEPLPTDLTLTVPKRKDANEVTEATILNPAIIPMSLDPALNRLMHMVFAYFLKAIQQKLTTTGFVPLMMGGGRSRRRHRRKRQKQQKRRTHKRR
jgi:hypothetical protein